MDIRQRMQDCGDDVDALRNLLNEINADKSIKVVDKKLATQSINMRIRVLSGVPTVQTDTLGGRNVHLVANSNGVSEDIGFMVSFSVSQSPDHLRIPNDELDNYWTEHGIPEREKPKAHREKDAFKCACSDFKGVKPVSETILALFPNAKAVVMDITPLSAHEYQLTRKIISIANVDEKKDVAEKYVLAHDKISKIILDETKTEIELANGRKSTQVSLRYRVIPENEAYADLVDEIHNEFMDRFELYKTHTSGNKVRIAVREMLLRNYGVNFNKTGGNYFVPKCSETVVAQFQEFLKWCNANYTHNGGKARMFSWAVRDDADTLQQIEDDVQEEMQNRMSDLYDKTLKELSNAENEEQVDAILAKKLEQHGKSTAMLNEYKEILKHNIEVKLDTERLRDTIKTRAGEISDRQRAMLQRLIAIQSD